MPCHKQVQSTHCFHRRLVVLVGDHLRRVVEVGVHLVRWNVGRYDMRRSDGRVTGSRSDELLGCSRRSCRLARRVAKTSIGSSCSRSHTGATGTKIVTIPSRCGEAVITGCAGNTRGEESRTTKRRGDVLVCQRLQAECRCEDLVELLTGPMGPPKPPRPGRGPGMKGPMPGPGIPIGPGNMPIGGMPIGPAGGKPRRKLDKSARGPPS
jgi:hypothetical protein